MAGLVSIFRKTLRKGTGAVRFIGKKTRNVVKRGTNTIGLTKRSRGPSRKTKKTRKTRKTKNRK